MRYPTLPYLSVHPNPKYFVVRHLFFLFSYVHALAYYFNKYGWYLQRPGNDFEVGVGGGGGVTLPKTKNSPDFAHIFLGGTQVHVQKQTKIKMNDIDSPKLKGRRPSGPVRGASAPASPSRFPGVWVIIPKQGQVKIDGRKKEE